MQFMIVRLYYLFIFGTRNNIYYRMKFLKLLRESVILALNSVTITKLRTFLTLFGITIGIFSIISVFTVLDRMEKSIRDSINSMGSNVIYVRNFLDICRI
jgi:putative ABC transport system permease protein